MRLRLFGWTLYSPAALERKEVAAIGKTWAWAFHEMGLSESFYELLEQQHKFAITLKVRASLGPDSCLGRTPAELLKEAVRIEYYIANAKLQWAALEDMRNKEMMSNNTSTTFTLLNIQDGASRESSEQAPDA